MSKKRSIPIKTDHELASIDHQLDDALGRLQQSNERVVDLLRTLEPSEEETEDATGENTDASSHTGDGHPDDRTQTQDPPSP